MPAIADLQRLAHDRSPFDKAMTEQVIEEHFLQVPRRLRFALDRWPELHDEAVLDVGCSFGQCLAHFGPGSLGIDSNPEHVAFCEALGLDATVIDAHAPDELGTERFDTLWVCDVVEHLVGPHEVLRSLRPAIKPGGRLILYLTVAPSNRAAKALMRRVDSSFEAQAHHYQFTYDTAVYLVERAGYRVVAAIPRARLPKRLTTRVYLEAVPDEAAERIAARAELRNRGGTRRPPL